MQTAPTRLPLSLPCYPPGVYLALRSALGFEYARYRGLELHGRALWRLPTQTGPLAVRHPPELVGLVDLAAAIVTGAL